MADWKAVWKVDLSAAELVVDLVDQKVALPAVHWVVMRVAVKVGLWVVD